MNERKMTRIGFSHFYSSPKYFITQVLCEREQSCEYFNKRPTQEIQQTFTLCQKKTETTTTTEEERMMHSVELRWNKMRTMVFRSLYKIQANLFVQHFLFMKLSC